MLSPFQFSVLLFVSWSAASPSDVEDPAISADAARKPDPFCVTPAYNISAAIEQAKRLANHSWEYGTASEALLEIYNPELAVFDPKSLSDGRLPHVPNVAKVPSLAYAKQFIELDNETLINGGGTIEFLQCQWYVLRV